MAIFAVHTVYVLCVNADGLFGLIKLTGISHKQWSSGHVQVKCMYHIVT